MVPPLPLKLNITFLPTSVHLFLPKNTLLSSLCQLKSYVFLRLTQILHLLHEALSNLSNPQRIFYSLEFHWYVCPYYLYVT